MVIILKVKIFKHEQLKLLLTAENGRKDNMQC